MLPLLVLLLLGVGCWSQPLDDPAWRAYKAEYGKIYTSEAEDTKRYEIWKESVAAITQHNAAYSADYEQGFNQFSDMTEEEFMETMTGGLQVPAEYYNSNGTLRWEESFVPPPASVAIPDTVNWVSKGYVTEVKSQGNCGSCYAFSATGALEGQWFRKTGKRPSLSEQQIVDCSRKWGNKGCGGGWYHSAWDYIRDVGGSDSEHGYPYEAKERDCRFKKESVRAQVKSHVQLRSEDEKALKQAVATVGPISVAIAVQGSLRRYKSGVYYERSCLKEFWQLNHAVLVVGYGTEDGKDYWLVKNSWGGRFGLEGYMKMSRNKRNNCGIATIPVYPVV